MGFLEVIMEASSLEKVERERAKVEGLEQGRQQGGQEGEARGLAKEARRILRLALATGFRALKRCLKSTASTASWSSRTCF